MLNSVAFHINCCPSVLCQVGVELLLGRIGVSSSEIFALLGAEESAWVLRIFQLLLLCAFDVDLVPAGLVQATVLIQRDQFRAVRDGAPAQFIVKIMPGPWLLSIWFDIENLLANLRAEVDFILVQIMIYTAEGVNPFVALDAT